MSFLKKLGILFLAYLAFKFSIACAEYNADVHNSDLAEKYLDFIYALKFWIKDIIAVAKQKVPELLAPIKLISNKLYAVIH